MDKYTYYSALIIPHNPDTKVCWRENKETKEAEDILCETIPRGVEVVDLTYRGGNNAAMDADTEMFDDDISDLGELGNK